MFNNCFIEYCHAQIICVAQNVNTLLLRGIGLYIFNLPVKLDVKFWF